MKSKYLADLIERYPALKCCEASILEAFDVLVSSFKGGNKLLIAGNGGSSADAEHIAGELMKGFCKKRETSKEFASKLCEIDSKRGEELAKTLQEGFPVIVLSNHQGLNTAFINDVKNGGEYLFAQQLNVYGKKGDVFLAISTSGSSENILKAAVVAKAKGLKIISLTGAKNSELSSLADVSIKAPSEITHITQEYHLPIYHCLCLMIEEHFFG